MKIYVNDKMQKDYVYEISEPEGTNFAKDFAPELTPKQMLSLGVFEGHYLNDCRAEFPNDWFADARLSPEKLCFFFYLDLQKNSFGVNCVQSIFVQQIITE